MTIWALRMKEPVSTPLLNWQGVFPDALLPLRCTSKVCGRAANRLIVGCRSGASIVHHLHVRLGYPAKPENPRGVIRG